MSLGSSIRLKHRPSLAFLLLCGFMAVLWLAGGASRADVMGQVVVRAAAWGAMIAALLGGVRIDLSVVRVPLILLTAALALVLLQLIPLPPAIWQSLPGRGLLAQPALIAGVPQPWRPLAIVPDLTVNAASSLIVPFVILLLVGGVTEKERALLPSILLGLVTVSMLVGLLQFSGVIFDHPLVNDTPGDVNGGFANRNHLALFLAIGIILSPAWVFNRERYARWRVPLGLGSILLFILTILATGSRTGMLLGALALLVGLLLAKDGIRKVLGRAPRWVLPAVLVAIVVIVAIFVTLSIAADRAASINRAFDLDTSQDMRTRGLPTVLSMIAAYFPAGSGFGGFDPLFRIHEPFALLRPTYFNRAHNDFLEIVLDGGLAGLTLLVCAVLWWAVWSVRVWHGGPSTARLGSGILLLVLVASVSDYPARTPMIMATIALAAVWLHQGSRSAKRSTLPVRNQRL